MARTIAAFTHMDETFTKGQDVPDSHPLVELAPHLFVQPKPEPSSEPDREQRIRGALVKDTAKVDGPTKE